MMLKNMATAFSIAFSQQQKLLASDAASSDQFGRSVALSSDGNTAIVGAPNENTSPNTDNGAAYVFTRTGFTWTEQQKLLASDAATDDQFGFSVALSSDGNTAIVGAQEKNTFTGAAYVFTRTGSTWTEQQKLLASDAASGDQFGISVALSSDGNTAIVGANLQDTSPNIDNGAVYVFTRSGSTWTEQQKLLASDAASSDQFGRSVALSSDGNTAIVGAPTEDTSPYTNNGAAYVFTRSGSTWTEQQKLTDLFLGATDGDMGRAVDLSSDGNTACISAPGLNSVSGRVYIFTRSGSTWTKQQTLSANDLAAGDSFGDSVALSSDGNLAFIGAAGEDTFPSVGNGAAYVFTRTGSTWTEQQKLLASDAASSDQFGRSVALSFDGNTAIVGANLESTAPNSQNGAAYVFV
jgi:phage gpG-like protein